MPPVTQEYTLIDTSNHLLAIVPAVLTTGLVPTQDGDKTALTIRTNTTTLTVLLAKQDLDAWAAQITKAAQRMSESGIQVVDGSAMGLLEQPPAAFSRRKG
jgi:hypothetical protein